MKFIGIYILWRKERNANTEKTETTFLKRYKPYFYLNWIEALLNMVKIYPNDEDILLKELFHFQNNFKNCFYKDLKEDSVRILNGILKLNNINQNVRNKINNII